MSLTREKRKGPLLDAWIVLIFMTRLITRSLCNDSHHSVAFALARARARVLCIAAIARKVIYLPHERPLARMFSVDGVFVWPIRFYFALTAEPAASVVSVLSREPRTLVPPVSELLVTRKLANSFSLAFASVCLITAIGI